MMVATRELMLQVTLTTQVAGEIYAEVALKDLRKRLLKALSSSGKSKPDGRKSLHKQKLFDTELDLRYYF